MEPTNPTQSLQALVARDRTQASLSVPAGLSRELFTLELGVQTLRDAGVQITKPVEQAVRDLVAAGPPAEGESTTIVARATPPTPGADARVEWATPGVVPGSTPSPTASLGAATRERVAAPSEGPPGEGAPAPASTAATDPTATAHADRVNLYEHSSFVVVEPGQVLGRCLEATPGQDGCDVTGQVLPAKPGRALDLKLDETILRDAQGQLLAQSAGVLIRTPGSPPSAKISGALEVPQYVDFSTGNIDFPGDVLVHRGVRDRFTVKAGGKLEVRGIIEGATIECGGDLTAHGGISGHEHGTFRAGGAVRAKYLDHVRGRVRGDLHVEREIINSDLAVGGQTRCPTGAIIGGTLTATGPVETSVLGSGAGTPTHLVLGTVPFLEDKLAQLDRLVAQLTQTRAALAAEQERLAHQHIRPTAQDRERQTEILFEAQSLDQNLTRARLLHETCLQHVAERRIVQVDITHRLFRGVTFTIQGTRYQITEDRRGPLRIGWQPGVGPVYQREASEPTPLIQIARTLAPQPLSPRERVAAKPPGEGVPAPGVTPAPGAPGVAPAPGLTPKSPAPAPRSTPCAS